MSQWRPRWHGHKEALAEHIAACKPLRKRRKKRKARGKRANRLHCRPNYYEYIRSPQWAAKRQMMFAKYDCCALCGSQEQLHVHHLHYKTLGHESPEDLAIVCLMCHQDLHSKEFWPLGEASQ